MGALLSIPILGGLGSLASSALSGIVFFMSGTAASALFKSCNCNSASGRLSPRACALHPPRPRPSSSSRQENQRSIPSSTEG